MSATGLPMRTPPSVSIIVMAYNEVETLGSVVEEIESALIRSGHPYEIVIVDDGSIDGTAAKADELAGRKPHVRVVHHPANLGIGQVKRTGYREARGDLVSFFPADGECPATILDAMLPIMGEYDVVLGYIPERTDSLLAIFLARAERLLIRLLFGPTPEFCGIYVFRRELLDRLPLITEGRGWMIQMEFIIRAKQAGYRMISVPTPMRLRTHGTSKVNNLKNIWANVKQLVRLFVAMRLRNRK